MASLSVSPLHRAWRALGQPLPPRCGGPTQLGIPEGWAAWSAVSRTERLPVHPCWSGRGRPWLWSAAHPRGDSISTASICTRGQWFSEFSKAHFSATHNAMVTVALPVLHKATDLKQKEAKGWHSRQLLGCLGNADFWVGSEADQTQERCGAGAPALPPRPAIPAPGAWILAISFPTGPDAPVSSPRSPQASRPTVPRRYVGDIISVLKALQWPFHRPQSEACRLSQAPKVLLR